MYLLKKSTAITIPIFAHDSSGDAVTGLLTGDWTKRISKASGAYAAMTVVITEMEGGWYGVALTTAHTDTNGLLSMYFTHANCKQVNLQFRVETRLGEDYAFPTTSGRSLDVDSTGTVGLDFNNVVGTLAVPSQITGIDTLCNALAASLALTAYAPLTTTQGNALAASLALTAYDALVPADLAIAVSSLTVYIASLRAHEDLLAASSALAVYDAPTYTEMDAHFTALNDITAADVWAATIETGNTAQAEMQWIRAYACGKITVVGNAYTYYAADGVTALFTLTASTTMRTYS